MPGPLPSMLLAAWEESARTGQEWGRKRQVDRGRHHGCILRVPGRTATTLAAEPFWLPSDPRALVSLLALGCHLGWIPTAGIKGTEAPTKCKDWISLQRKQESHPRAKF